MVLGKVAKLCEELRNSYIVQPNGIEFRDIQNYSILVLMCYYTFNINFLLDFCLRH